MPILYNLYSSWVDYYDSVFTQVGLFYIFVINPGSIIESLINAIDLTLSDSFGPTDCYILFDWQMLKVTKLEIFNT